ncbi:MAG: hypothetical protein LQ339_006379 [Xanthoria mediterranea]|nr:MAG: hypothetical protein LQ339_006379 [Xanthoria mediterranea]
MKILLTGPTGHIGSNVLQAALLHPAITSIIAFSRRQLPTPFPDPQNKLQLIIQSDFTHYSDDVLEVCAGAEACIWGMGVANMETRRSIIVDSAIAAARAFVDAKIAGEGNKFRFVHLSGTFVEKDQKKSLWFMNEGRKIRGETEVELMKMEKEHPEALVAYIARPGVVTATKSFFPALLEPLARFINVEDLAAKMLDTAINGHHTQTLEVDVLRDEGKRLRKQSRVDNQ